MIEDPEGFDLSSVDAARQEAVGEARSMLAADVSRGTIDLTNRVEVADETGSIIATVPFAEAVEIIQ